MTAENSARLNMRITPQALETIREAAAAQQQDLTSFVLGAAMERARDVLIAERVTRLTASEASALEAALEREPQVVPELAALIRNARKDFIEVKGAREGSRAH